MGSRPIYWVITRLHGDRDRIFPGHALLKKLLRANFVLTAAGMVRRECYEKVSFFPLDMPWCGDWYLWCVFALHYDVAYFAEPMVCYRKHAAEYDQHSLAEECGCLLRGRDRSGLGE